MAHWPFWISGAALLAGAGMGLAGLVNPRWARDLVRLQDSQEKPGGFAEFRGTYGGLFLSTHGVGLALMARHLHVADAGPQAGAAALGALAVCGALWIGTGCGRLISIMNDGTNTKFNQASVLFEFALGLAILAPVLAR